MFGAHNDICMCYEEYIKRGSKEKLKCSNYVHGLQYINNLLRLRKICRWATKLCSTNTAFFVLYWNMIILLEFIASKTIRISSVRFEDYTRTRYKPSRKTGGLDYSFLQKTYIRCINLLFINFHRKQIGERLVGWKFQINHTFR